MATFLLVIAALAIVIFATFLIWKYLWDILTFLGILLLIFVIGFLIYIACVFFWRYKEEQREWERRQIRFEKQRKEYAERQAAEKQREEEKRKQAEEARRKKAEKLGTQGENAVAEILQNITYSYRIVRNLYVPREDGTTTEIDSILINEYGIFVFEVKNYTGWIFGTEEDQLWTVKYIGGQTEKLYNPIRQNRLHTKCIRNQIDPSEILPFHSITVFAGKSELKSDIGELNENEKVLSITDLEEELINITCSAPELFTTELINRIADLLESKFANKDNSEKEQHIEDINEKHSRNSPCPNFSHTKTSNNQAKPKRNVCDICGRPSGRYPLCRSCAKEKENGNIVKCSVCGKWHKINESCTCSFTETEN